MEPTPTTNNDLELDRSDLIGEAARQASLYGYYADQAVKARSDRDTAVNRLTQRSAELNLQFRKMAADKGLKVTEGTIQAQLDSDPELIELKADLVRTNANYITLDSMLKALDHKKSMIEIVSRLTLSEKYAAAKANDPTLQGGAYGDASADAVRDYLNQ